MTTKLEGPLKREVMIDRASYTLTITPEGMSLAPKGKRKGFELEWRALVSGDAALATALNASLTAKLDIPVARKRAPGKKQAVPAKKRKR
jgi:hypothetical protein